MSMILLEPANKITHAKVGDQAADHLSNPVFKECQGPGMQTEEKSYSRKVRRDILPPRVHYGATVFNCDFAVRSDVGAGLGLQLLRQASMCPDCSS
jgi:hypothetical protein